ncbi:TonB family protein [Gemmatimonadota bacterium]
MKSMRGLFLIVGTMILLTACSKQSIPTATVLEAETVDETVASIEVIAPGATPVFLAWEQPPKPVKRVMPKYPEEALQDGSEGKVILNIVVDEKGVVTEAKVITADPPGVFDEAAIEAMKQWVFEPAEQAGVPIKVRLAYPIVFSLVEKKQ